MSNPYYTPAGTPGVRSSVSSAAIRNEFAAIAAGFDAVVAAGGDYLKVDGSVVATGMIESTSVEAIRIKNSGAFVSGYNAAGTQRSGFLQFAEAGYVRLASDSASGVQLESGGVPRLTITNAGKVLIGRTFPISGATLEVAGPIGTTISTGTSGYGVMAGSFDDAFEHNGNTIHNYSLSWRQLPYGALTGPAAVLSGLGGVSLFTNRTERLRVDDGGTLFVGTGVALHGTHTISTPISGGRIAFQNTSASQPHGIRIYYGSAAPNNGANEFLMCNDVNAVRLLVYSNGGIANFQGNNTNLSDQRLKKDIEPLASYWDKWKAIGFKSFRYKDQTDDQPTIGVIAQQLEAVAPEFVSSAGFGPVPDDGVPLKSVFTSDLFHAMGRVVQELQRRVEALET